MAFKQETFKGKNTYGNEKKCVLSVFGRGKYSVAYYKNPAALKADDGVADFKTRKEAIQSIEFYIN